MALPMSLPVPYPYSSYQSSISNASSSPMSPPNPETPSPASEFFPHHQNQQQLQDTAYANGTYPDSELAGGSAVVVDAGNANHISHRHHNPGAAHGASIQASSSPYPSSLTHILTTFKFDAAQHELDGHSPTFPLHASQPSCPALSSLASTSSVASSCSPIDEFRQQLHHGGQGHSRQQTFETSPASEACFTRKTPLYESGMEGSESYNGNGAGPRGYDAEDALSVSGHTRHGSGSGIWQGSEGGACSFPNQDYVQQQQQQHHQGYPTSIITPTLLRSGPEPSPPSYGQQPSPGQAQTQRYYVSPGDMSPDLPPIRGSSGSVLPRISQIGGAGDRTDWGRSSTGSSPSQTSSSYGGPCPTIPPSLQPNCLSGPYISRQRLSVDAGPSSYQSSNGSGPLSSLSTSPSQHQLAQSSLPPRKAYSAPHGREYGNEQPGYSQPLDLAQPPQRLMRYNTWSGGDDGTSDHTASSSSAMSIPSGGNWYDKYSTSWSESQGRNDGASFMDQELPSSQAAYPPPNYPARRYSPPSHYGGLTGNYAASGFSHRSDGLPVFYSRSSNNSGTPSPPFHVPATVFEGVISYTDNSGEKETPTLRRRCHNCSNTEPPSWRRSTMTPGKIVCNRCGLYERTHNRARPATAVGDLRKLGTKGIALAYGTGSDPYTSSPTNAKTGESLRTSKKGGQPQQHPPYQYQ